MRKGFSTLLVEIGCALHVGGVRHGDETGNFHSHGLCALHHPRRALPSGQPKAAVLS